MPSLDGVRSLSVNKEIEQNETNETLNRHVSVDTIDTIKRYPSNYKPTMALPQEAIEEFKAEGFFGGD